MDDPVSLYLDVPPDELVDLEVAAKAAIEWSLGLKAAAAAVDREYEYRVSLVAAERGSSKWLAKVERSKPNQMAQQVKKGWEEVPLILRWSISLAVVIPVTAVPTVKYWTGDDKFSDAQLQQIEQTVQKAAKDPTVTAHRQRIYREVQRDRKIRGVGAGVADSPGWKPKQTVPANQFPEAEGLFQPQEAPAEERTITPELDVILVAPNLHNAPRAWTFRQEGIPGTFNATMKDKEFLEALERSAVREQFRADIPMRIRLAIKQRLVDGEWKVKRRGRSVTEVILPKIG